MNHYKCYLKQLIFNLSTLPNNCTGMAIFQPNFHQGTLLIRKVQILIPVRSVGTLLTMIRNIRTFKYVYSGKYNYLEV